MNHSYPVRPEDVRRSLERDKEQQLEFPLAEPESPVPEDAVDPPSKQLGRYNWLKIGYGYY